MMRRLGAAPVEPSNLFTLAATAAGVIALIEFPISKFYSTVPPTKTHQRMIIAGGMAFLSVLIAGAILRKKE